ncbi:saccharopine dehydrogenase [Campylobacter sp.]|uniref:saccharopine dehydrogenase n=1 Tax=Campylobacter sp. TaxID=205 RepID=UPI0036223C30
MKIVIINENPAVSRLATLALDKIGLEYAQIGNAGELDGPCDVLIVDSDSDAKDANLKQFANKILYLSSKNAPTFEGADRILPKPFLPTEFIAIVEDLASKSKEAANEAKAKPHDDEVSVKGFEFMDDLGDEIFKEEPAPIDADEFDLEGILDDDPVLSGDDAAGFEEPGDPVKFTDYASQEPESKADEPNFDESEADNDKFEDINEQEALGELDDFEIAVKEEDFNGLDLDDEFGDEVAEQNEPQEAKFETFGDSIEDIKSQIDEIDAMDEEAFEATSDESETKDAEDADERFVELDAKPNDTGFENSQEPGVELALGGDKESQIFISDEAAQEGGETLDVKNEEPENDENLTQEVLDDEVAGEGFLVGGQAEALTSGDQAELNEDKEAQNELAGSAKFDAEKYSQIEQISEKDMALALNESGFASGKAADLGLHKSQTASKIDELKAQISDAVAKNLENSLQDGELREALKNLNIKINISFEEK